MRAVKIFLKGKVQGVGMRPFVYRKAKENSVHGYVRNVKSGVELHAEADSKDLDKFVDEVKSAPPPIEFFSYEMREEELNGFDDFEIKPSERKDLNISYLPDDRVPCAKCLTEMNDPKDRRYEYAFISCTDCGPRRSVTADLPFDRENTSYKDFPMCEKCLLEYKDPDDRRFHAQTISCPECGPSLYSGKNSVSPEDIAKRLKAGEIIALKGRGGFQLLCDAGNAESIKELRRRKKRPSKPLAVMFKEFPGGDEKLKSAIGPICLLKGDGALENFDLIASGQDRVGVFLPSTPLHHLIFKYFDGPLIATSANIHSEPLIYEDDYKSLSDLADFIVSNNLKITESLDDPVVKDEILIRRGRGNASHKIDGSVSRQILGMGGDLKSSFAFSLEGDVFSSQYIGDLASYKVSQRYRDLLLRQLRLFKYEPEVVVVDKHPGYLSRDIAKELFSDKNIIEVQHHKAHAASVICEHKIKGDFVAVVLDGVGYGNDGTIWGAEIFRGFSSDSELDIERELHFKAIKFAGGDSVSKNPYKSMLSYLMDAGLKDFEQNIYSMQLEKDLGTFYSSSAGRLFDAVSCMLGLGESISFEGEAAMKLEALASRTYSKDFYQSYEISKYIDFSRVIRDINRDIGELEPSVIAMKFHRSLAQALYEAVVSVASCKQVVLSGGCFQNSILLSMFRDLLHKSGHSIYINHGSSPNDSSLAIGQVYLANFI